MHRTLAEQALSRVCDYLSATGIELTREVTMQVLRLVEEGLASDHENPMHWIMMRVTADFALQNPELPDAIPPILRGSMGYHSP